MNECASQSMCVCELLSNHGTSLKGSLKKAGTLAVAHDLLISSLLTVSDDLESAVIVHAIRPTTKFTQKITCNTAGLVKNWQLIGKTLSALIF